MLRMRVAWAQTSAAGVASRVVRSIVVRIIYLYLSESRELGPFGASASGDDKSKTYERGEGRVAEEVREARPRSRRRVFVGWAIFWNVVFGHDEVGERPFARS